VEKFGVFIPFKGETDFSSGLPVKRSLPNGDMKSIHSERAQTGFWRRKGARFLKEVQKVDKKPTVSFSLRAGGLTF
jgi:hypothetical protein